MTHDGEDTAPLRRAEDTELRLAPDGTRPTPEPGPTETRAVHTSEPTGSTGPRSPMEAMEPMEPTGTVGPGFAYASEPTGPGPASASEPTGPTGPRRPGLASASEPTEPRAASATDPTELPSAPPPSPLGPRPAPVSDPAAPRPDAASDPAAPQSGAAPGKTEPQGASASGRSEPRPAPVAESQASRPETVPEASEAPPESGPAPAQLPQDRSQAILEAAKQIGALLKRAGHPFALAGSVAVYAHGGSRYLQHDADFAILPDDAEAVAATLREAGLAVRVPPEDWLIKTTCHGQNVDIIFSLAHQPVTREMLDRAHVLPVDSVLMPVLSPTDLIQSLISAFSEHYCDFGSVLPVARAVREKVDWDAVRAACGAEPMPAAFLFLLERLNVIDAIDAREGRP